MARRSVWHDRHEEEPSCPRVCGFPKAAMQNPQCILRGILTRAFPHTVSFRFGAMIQVRRITDICRDHSGVVRRDRS
jgi:hypothetical protein